MRSWTGGLRLPGCTAARPESAPAGSPAPRQPSVTRPSSARAAGQRGGNELLPCTGDSSLSSFHLPPILSACLSGSGISPTDLMAWGVWMVRISESPAWVSRTPTRVLPPARGNGLALYRPARHRIASRAATRAAVTGPAAEACGRAPFSARALLGTLPGGRARSRGPDTRHSAALLGPLPGGRVRSRRQGC